MDWKINLLLLLMIIFVYKLYYQSNPFRLINNSRLHKETFINNNISINNNIENTYGLDKRCDLKNPKKVIPNEVLVKSNKIQLYKNPKYNIKNNHGFNDTLFLKNFIQIGQHSINNSEKGHKYFKNCMNKYIDLDREILKVPLYIYPELYYHPLDEP